MLLDNLMRLAHTPFVVLKVSKQFIHSFFAFDSSEFLQPAEALFIDNCKTRRRSAFQVFQPQASSCFLHSAFKMKIQ